MLHSALVSEVSLATRLAEKSGERGLNWVANGASNSSWWAWISGRPLYMVAQAVPEYPIGI